MNIFSNLAFYSGHSTRSNKFAAFSNTNLLPEMHGNRHFKLSRVERAHTYYSICFFSDAL